MRTLPAPPCSRCGSTDTYADAIKVPSALDSQSEPVPVIPGTLHCRRCDRCRTADTDAVAAAFDVTAEDAEAIIEVVKNAHLLGDGWLQRGDDGRLRAKSTTRVQFIVPPRP
ncbi:MAG: hypothetical protein LC798_17095 [Chloroflexi bacterium]|nr:hypothetical protein [Chloroflexota bacterium]